MPSQKTKKTTQKDSLLALQELVYTAERSLYHAKNIIAKMTGVKSSFHTAEEPEVTDLHAYKSNKAKIIEGIFTGKDMLGADKKLYPVPANYASKSKIVEGSKLKMTLKPDGSYQYKIINEIDFETSAGTLIKDGEHFVVISQKGIFRVLPAAITYLQAHIGDRVAIRIPRGTHATYATIDTLLPHDLDLIES